MSRSDDPTTATPEEQAEIRRYLAAGHALQSAIAYRLGMIAEGRLPRGLGTPKDLRTGVDMSLSGSAAIAELLMRKGVFTRLEYFRALADWVEGEVRHQETDMTNLLGAPVTFL